jgi:predicted esterase
MIKENQIRISKSARYFVLGADKGIIKKIWFVFHGYGQLAKEFLEEFKIMNDENTLVVALEGLNKFYVRGFHGKVGSCWMTKECRTEEISDYVNMINMVYEEIISSPDRAELDISVLGFSQGTHTAVRWLNYCRIEVNKLILWSGTFPRDGNYVESSDYWNKIEKKIVVGNRDKLINKEKLQVEIDYLQSQNLYADFIEFDGGHEIDSILLKKLIS